MFAAIMFGLLIALIFAVLGGIGGYLFGYDRGQAAEAEKWKEKGDWTVTEAEKHE